MEFYCWKIILVGRFLGAFCKINEDVSRKNWWIKIGFFLRITNNCHWSRSVFQFYTSQLHFERFPWTWTSHLEAETRHITDFFNIQILHYLGKYQWREPPIWVQVSHSCIVWHLYSHKSHKFSLPFPILFNTRSQY